MRHEKKSVIGHCTQTCSGLGISWVSLTVSGGQRPFDKSPRAAYGEDINAGQRPRHCLSVSARSSAQLAVVHSAFRGSLGRSVAVWGGRLRVERAVWTFVDSW